MNVCFHTGGVVERGLGKKEGTWQEGEDLARRRLSGRQVVEENRG